jgi:hypothetical protein
LRETLKQEVHRVLTAYAQRGRFCETDLPPAPPCGGQ